MNDIEDIALILLVLLSAALIAWRLAEQHRRHKERPEPSPRRVVFPFIGQALSQPVLDATLRIAGNESATLVPAYLARVPLHLPLAAAIPRQCTEAMPLLEAIEQRATEQGVPVDTRIERGRTYRHALRQLLAHERYDRIVVAADTAGTDGFDAEDIAWLLDHAQGEILVVRPARDTLIRVPPAPAERLRIQDAALVPHVAGNGGTHDRAPAASASS